MLTDLMAVLDFLRRGISYAVLQRMQSFLSLSLRRASSLFLQRMFRQLLHQMSLLLGVVGIELRGEIKHRITGRFKRRLNAHGSQSCI